jgi:hypothetical protein
MMPGGPFFVCARTSSHWSAAVTKVLAVIAIVFVASVALSQAPRAQERFMPAPVPAGPNKTQKWEYKVSDRGGFNPEAWEKRLNDMAKEGWELDQIDQGEGVYIFRRSITGPVIF